MSMISSAIRDATEAVPGGPLVLAAGALALTPAARRGFRLIVKSALRISLATTGRVRAATSGTREALGELTDEVRRERTEQQATA